VPRGLEKGTKQKIKVMCDNIIIYHSGREVGGGSVHCLISARGVGSCRRCHGGEGGSDIDPRRLHIEKPTR